MELSPVEARRLGAASLAPTAELESSSQQEWDQARPAPSYGDDRKTVTFGVHDGSNVPRQKHRVPQLVKEFEARDSRQDEARWGAGRFASDLFSPATR